MYRDIILADNPVAYWRMDDGGGALTIRDMLGKHDITTGPGVLVDKASLLNSDSNHALQNTATANPTISTPNHADFDLTVAFSMEAWIFANTLPGSSVSYGVIGHSQTSPSQNGALIFIRSGSLGNQAVFSFQGVGSCIDSVALPVAKPQHLVGVYDPSASTKMTFYRNGVVVATQPSIDPVATTAVYQVFNAAGFGSPIGTDFVLDELAHYKYALTPGQVERHNSAGQASPLGILQQLNPASPSSGLL